jgi:hypothetical protein
VAEKNIEQFAAPELPIIEDAFQITHQQAAAAHGPQESSSGPSRTLEDWEEHSSKKSRRRRKKVAKKDRTTTFRLQINYQEWAMPQVMTELGMILQWEINPLPKRQGQG